MPALEERNKICFSSLHLTAHLFTQVQSMLKNFEHQFIAEIYIKTSEKDLKQRAPDAREPSKYERPLFP